MLPEKRHDYIMEKLKINKSVLVKDLSRELSVTQETIRRDLQFLENKNMLIKTHGGAFIRDGVNNDIDVRIRETIYLDAKKKIGRACAEMINDGETILLDGSTISLQIIQQIKNRCVTILTNSLMAADAVSNCESIKLILLGGNLDHHSLSFLGFDTIDMLSRYYVDKAFISCRGADKRTGITDSNEQQARARNAMLKSAKTSYLVIDQTKLDVVAFSKIAEVSDFDHVVIEAISPDWIDFFQSKGVDIIIAQN